MYFSRFLLIVGVVSLFLSWVAFKFPEVFFHGRRSGFWHHLIGEAWTRRLIRYVSVPLVLFIGGAQIYLGLAHERMIWKANRGDVEAQYRLADHLYRGDVQAKDLNRACKWFERAAENGSIRACLRLGRIHEDQGRPHQAFTWFMRAALRGNARAQESVAHRYAAGIGIEKSPDEAWRWYHKAAEAGGSTARIALGRLTLAYFGDSVGKVGRARYLLGKAVSSNDSTGEASWVMAQMMLEGAGGPPDPEAGYAWTCLAAARGSRQAVRKREALDKVLSPEQKHSADKEKQKLFLRFASASRG
jgi:hypothetical protein